ncbi:4Fe-4S binding protein [Succinispira mobilis]|uniref:4Fe-4S binding protein n=1 Tax=Succinispira mobilis TaxID=78120 RepID=UPI000A00CE83
MTTLFLSIQLSIFLLLIAGFYSKIRPGFIFLLPLAFVAGNFFCGWICPFGSAQEFVGKLGSLVLKKKFKTPPFLQKYLQYSRYLLAVLTLFLASQTILDLGFFNSYKAFMHSAAGKNITALALTVMGSFLFIGMFFERPFCNFFCPEGIRHGLLSLGRIFTIKMMFLAVFTL